MSAHSPSALLVGVTQTSSSGSTQWIALAYGYPEPIQPGLTRIGWIGAGVMGAAMAGRILAAGYSLTIYARTPSKALHLQRLGAVLADSPAAVAAASDVLFTMVSHPADVRSTALAALPSLAPSSVFVDMTSSSPALAREIAAAARDHGCWAIDAPVSGGDTGARDGTLAILAGGEQSIIVWLAPLFNVMGKATRMGDAGCGQSSKIANQIVVGGSLLGLSECLTFARAEGLDEKMFLEAMMEGTSRSRSMELYGERMLKRDFRPGGFPEYMVKDLGMGLEFLGDEGAAPVVIPGAAQCKQLFVGMVAQGKGKMGIHGLITVLESMNGKEVDEEKA